MDEQHSTIFLEDNDSYDRLLEKCEIARTQMREYEEERIILDELSSDLETWRERRGDPYLSEYSPKEHMALWVILGVRKKEVTEERIRRILRILKLPENRVLTVRRYGASTEYIIPKNGTERRLIERQNKVEAVRSKYMKEITRVLRKVDRHAYADIILNDDGKPVRLAIHVYRNVEPEEDDRKQKVVSHMVASGFKVESSYLGVSGLKTSDLNGTEGIKEMSSIVSEMMSDWKLI